MIMTMMMILIRVTVKEKDICSGGGGDDETNIIKGFVVVQVSVEQLSLL